MTEPLPERAVTLAAVALHDAECPDRTCSDAALGAYYRQARIALEAAYPHLRSSWAADELSDLGQEIEDDQRRFASAKAQGAAEAREEIALLAGQHDARYYPAGCHSGHPFADLIRNQRPASQEEK